jgi:hypothetical protein
VCEGKRGLEIIELRGEVPLAFLFKLQPFWAISAIINLAFELHLKQIPKH